MDNAQFQHIFDVVRSPILVVDSHQRIFAANKAFYSVLNIPHRAQKDWIGQNLFDRDILESYELSEQYRRLLAGETNEVTHAISPVGDLETRIYLTIRLDHVKIDDINDNVLSVLTHDDVTESVLASQFAHTANDMLDEIQEVTGFGWWNLDIPTQTAVWSKQEYAILGYEPGVDEANSDNFISRIHPDDREKAMEALGKPFRDGGPYAAEFRLLLPNGKIRHVSEHGRVLFDKNGIGLRYMGTTLDLTERVEAEQKLRNSEQELREILQNLQDTYYRTNESGLVVRASPSVEKLLGYRPEEVIGMPITELYVNPDERTRLFHEMKHNNGSAQGFEATLRHKDGSIVWVSTNSRFVLDDNGKYIGVEGTTRDITDKKLAEIQMQKLSQAMEQSADAVCITNSFGIIEYVNPAFEQATGFTYDESIGKTTAILKSGRMSDDFYRLLWATISTGHAFSELFVNKKKDGTLYYEQKTITPLKNNHNDITHYVSTGRDVTEFVHTQEQIKFLAHHDALTSLPNRALFKERLEHAVSIAKRQGGSLTVLFFDLDRFKVINDTLGHHYGDLLLKDLAVRLRNCVRDKDTVARLGGDEFAILSEESMSENDISTLANKILDVVAKPFRIDGRELHITSSIGISSYPQDGDEPELLLRNADVAMYKAKELGRNNFTLYSSELSEQAVTRLAMENALRHALDRHEFHVFYQPQVNIRSGEVEGVEALLRWYSPHFGLVMPNDFIFLLEEIGLINLVGEWVIHTACEQLKRWHDSGFSNLSVSINLSSRQCDNTSIVNIVRNAVALYQIDPRLIDLEITESLLMRNVTSVDETLENLSAIGVNVAIDDFGTGYSSLSYLKRFPIDILKIDRAFTKDIVFDGSSTNDVEIVKAIIAMGRTLNLKTIAEGVESEEQCSFLAEHHCDLVQGYWISKPLSASSMSDWLEQQYALVN